MAIIVNDDLEIDAELEIQSCSNRNARERERVGGLENGRTKDA